jgi:23S rRNA pseudouridine2605 synthase
MKKSTDPLRPKKTGKKGPESEAADANGKPGLIRLNKFLAQAGLCSRRAADELIKAGRIAVNGEPVAAPGVSVNPAADTVSLDGRPIAASSRIPPVVVILHKPTMVVTTVSDPQKRQTVIDLLPERLRTLRLFPVGRLDYFSEGLLLLTNDGELAYRLTHPKWHLPKTYRVLVRETPSPDKLDPMRQGMTLAEGDQTAPIKVAADKPRDDGATWLTMELIQGLNRQIRRMCRDQGLTVLRIVRTAHGPVGLGDLAKSASRELFATEIAALRASVGMAEG